MMLGIAWRWQAEVHGGFGKPLERQLATLEAAFRQGPRGSFGVLGTAVFASSRFGLEVCLVVPAARAKCIG